MEFAICNNPIRTAFDELMAQFGLSTQTATKCVCIVTK